jgi:hypothetical protein
VGSSAAGVPLSRTATGWGRRPSGTGGGSGKHAEVEQHRAGGVRRLPIVPQTMVATFALVHRVPQRIQVSVGQLPHRPPGLDQKPDQHLGGHAPAHCRRVPEFGCGAVEPVHTPASGLAGISRHRLASLRATR